MIRSKFAAPVFIVLTTLSLFCNHGHSQSIVAYQIDEGVVGRQEEFGGTLGMDFDVTYAIQVDSLGAFDSGSDGFALPITVELWSRDDFDTPDDPSDDDGDQILASVDFEEGDTGTAIGGSRFLDLSEPVTLAPGAYTIVAFGYGPGEPNFNLGGAAGGPAGLKVTDSRGIRFTGGGRFGDPGPEVFPFNADGGPFNRYGAGTFSFTYIDTDGDGAPDGWEEENDLDPEDPADGAMDLDGDGLSNAAEFVRGTDVNKADTDGDGLNDNVETGTGVWVDADDRGTSALVTDTDKDGLADNIESNSGVFVDASNPGTSPVNPDTDGDGFDDSREIDEGSDPTDKNDVPEAGQVIGEVAILVEAGRTGNQSFGGALGIDFVVNRPIRILELGAFDEDSDGFNTEITVELWSREDEGTPDDFSDDFGGEILASTVFSEEAPGDILEGFQFRKLDSPLSLEPGAYTIVGWGYNADEQNGNDGVSPFSTDLTESDAIEFVGTSRFGDAGAGGDFPTSVDGGPEVRYGAGSFTFDEGSSLPFQITQITFDGAKRSVTVEWNSSPAATYAVAYSIDLEQWIELEDGLPSDGEITEFTEENVPADSPWRYYRVRSE
ncbi:MAG: hypothetical protein R3F19_10940 [Verrucomicrobiales bacterium]